MSIRSGASVSQLLAVRAVPRAARTVRGAWRTTVGSFIGGNRGIGQMPMLLPPPPRPRRRYFFFDSPFSLKRL